MVNTYLGNFTLAFEFVAGVFDCLPLTGDSCGALFQDLWQAHGERVRLHLLDLVFNLTRLARHSACHLRSNFAEFGAVHPAQPSFRQSNLLDQVELRVALGLPILAQLS
jgi:hypothetical protein